MSNTITLELPNSGHGCDICRHQDKDGLVWGIVNDHPFIGCIPFALLVLLMLFCMFMATAQALFSRIVRYFELAELMAGMSPKCLAS